jgi:hypothetical protein
MASHARSLMTELLTALRQTHTHTDLATVSGTARVVVDQAEPPVITGPWLALSTPRVLPENSAITPLTQYEVEGTIDWKVFVASDRESPEERGLDALDAASDVLAAVQVAHAAPGTYPTLGACHLFLCSQIEVFGDASVGAIPYGMAMGSFRYRALVERGI